jgi:hypothetical protein
MLIRDDDGGEFYKFPLFPTQVPPIAVRIEDHVTLPHASVLQLLFEADPWDSLISFEPGIPVELGGTLELTFADDVDVATQVGRTLRIFDWTGVTPLGQFEIRSPYVWDRTNLYTTGEVTLLAFSTPLAGDFDQNGVVDAADYVAWRKGLGTDYTHDDYEVWRAHFGTGSSGIGAGSGAAGYPLGASAEPLPAIIPERSTAPVLLVGILGLAACCRIARSDCDAESTTI